MFSFERDINFFPDSYQGGCWSFYNNMMDPKFQRFFGECGNNYDVEDLLTKARVIRVNNLKDSEYSAVGIYFRSEKAARGFIDRLNAYVESKTKSLA